MSEIARRRVNAVVASGKLAEVFDAMCYLEGRRPHELVADVMRDYLDAKLDHPDVAAAVRGARRAQIGLRVIEA